MDTLRRTRSMRSSRSLYIIEAAVAARLLFLVPFVHGEGMDENGAVVAEEMLLEEAVSGELVEETIEKDATAEVPEAPEEALDEEVAKEIAAEEVAAEAVAEPPIPEKGVTMPIAADAPEVEAGTDTVESLAAEALEAKEVADELPPAEEPAEVAEADLEEVPAEKAPAAEAVEEEVFAIPTVEDIAKEAGVEPPVTEPPAAEPPATTEKEPPAAIKEDIEEDLRLAVEEAFKTETKPAATEEPPPPEPPVPREREDAVLGEEAAVPAAVSTAIATAEAREELRRQAYREHAREMMRQAAEDMESGRYDDAIKKYENAIRDLSLPQDYKLRQTAQRGLAETFYRQSIYHERKDDLNASLVSAQNAMDAGHPRGQRRVVYVSRLKEDPPPPPRPPPVDVWDQPDYRERQKKVADLLRRGREHYMAREFDAAQRDFESVMNLDPYNTEAMRLIRKVSQRKYDLATMELEATRNDMMSRLRKTWNPRDYALAEEAADRMPVTRVQRMVDSSRDRILRKMEQIVIPEIDFRLANINDVIEFLQETSIENDTKETDDSKKGINIILHMGGATPGAATQALSDDPFAEAATPATGAAAGGEVPLITFSARYITLLEALRIVTSVANLKFRIEGNVVMVVAVNAPDGPVIIRMYDVLPSVEDKMQSIGASFATGGGGFDVGGDFRTLEPAAAGGQELDWKAAFKGMGVEWPNGSHIRYVRAMGKLIVANTENNLIQFEKILAVLNVVPYQIEIEARFVEISRSDASSLGFEWLLTDDFELAQHPDDAALPMASRRRLAMPADPEGLTKINRYLSKEGLATQIADDLLTVSSVLTNPELSFVLHMLEQRGYADLLSAPKVTTQAGTEATIKVVTEYVYPTDFEVTPITGTSGVAGTSTIVGGVVEPSGFETREVGVILSVLPDVSPEGRMINLTMTPEVVTEPEWKDYGSVYTDAEGNEQRLSMEQPFFHTRSLSTSISIYNGATVVMGGMINETRQDVDDKIPFLGDIPIVGKLFRSKYEKSEKRNLLIFVTARLVDPAGRRIEQSGVGIGALAESALSGEAGLGASGP